MKESCKNIDLKRKKDRDIQCIRKKKKKDFQSTRDFYYFEKRILCRKRLDGKIALLKIAFYRISDVSFRANL